MWDLFEPVTETVSNVGQWMSQNPGATQAIGGAAAAGMKYMDSEKQREFDMRRDREERAWRENRSKASGGNYDYGSHNSSLTKGLLAG